MQIILPLIIFIIIILSVKVFRLIPNYFITFNYHFKTSIIILLIKYNKVYLIIKLLKFL